MIELDFLASGNEVDLSVRGASGVYVLLRQGRVVYVGASTNVQLRITNHRDGHSDSGPFDRAVWFPVTPSLLGLVEGALIRALNPIRGTKAPRDIGKDHIILRELGLETDPLGRFAKRQDRFYRRWWKRVGAGVLRDLNAHRRRSAGGAA